MVHFLITIIVQKLLIFINGLHLTIFPVLLLVFSRYTIRRNFGSSKM